MTTSGEREKNEKVLHARIPESLDDELRARASALGMSVSNLVRNILDNTFELVEDVIVDTGRLARSARGERVDTGASAPGAGGAQAPGRVVGWQTMILNVNAICSTCNAILPKGTDAAIAVTDGPGARPILCTDCLSNLSEGGE